MGNIQCTFRVAEFSHSWDRHILQYILDRGHCWFRLAEVQGKEWPLAIDEGQGAIGEARE